ncbi:MAG: hypothetical protein LUF30_01505 [Lachnospiraceae bacterium]|nr:hypothetical protein [Lachnospiraceae bacterium]
MLNCLDAWSGEVTPIAEYTNDGDSLTISMQLSGEDAAMIAIANDGWSSKAIENCVAETTADGVVYDESAESNVSLRATEAGEYSVTFADGTEKTVTVDAAEEAILLTDWRMILNQWTEETDTEDPFDTRVVPTDEYDLSETGLVPWYEIDSENLTKVAGVASYTTSFELEKGWEEGQGAYLEFTDISDIGRLYVNGQEVAMNQISLRADIGKYLTAGTNTIEVLVSSNLSNIKYAVDGESWWYGPYTAESCTYVFGIIGDVTLTPYTYTAINLD